MKKIIIIAATTLFTIGIGCGGSIKSPVDNPPPPRATPTPVPAPTPASTPITSDQVFQNIPQIWKFQSQCQNMQQNGTLGPWIVANTQIEVIPLADTIDVDGVTVIHNTVWHYTKDQPCAYWMLNSVFYEDPTKPLEELYFFLQTDKTFETTGAWYSPGGHIIAPNGFPWDVSHTPVDEIYSNPTDPGKPRPYLILANSGISVDTTFTDLGIPNTRWATFMTVDNQSRLSSEQFEGPRGHEIWHFAIGRGLVLVEALNQGQLTNVDPRQNLIRIN